MKKKIGILSIALIASIMFLNVNLSNNIKNDVGLASIIATNIANAETSVGCFYTGSFNDNCTWAGVTIVGCFPSASIGNCTY